MDLPLWPGCLDQTPRCSRRSGRGGQRQSRRVENVGIAVPWARRSKVRVVENIKHFHAELYVEVFRDSLDLIVLEYREVQVSRARADHDIAAGISAKIETLERTWVYRASQARRRRVAVG